MNKSEKIIILTTFSAIIGAVIPILSVFWKICAIVYLVLFTLYICCTI